MQLTDNEIREILIREKRRKKLIQKRKRRRNLIILILLLIALIALFIFIKHKPSAAGTGTAEESPLGVIFIDPGHGGSDPGADNGTRYEKDDTLKLSLAIAEKLRELNYTVVLSREKDTDVEISERSKMAEDSKAQLMVSIHRNQADGGQGVEAFIPASDTAESRLLAENLVKALAGCGFKEREVHAGTLSSASESYEEIASVSMPAVLLEVGFIDSEEDNALIDEKTEDIASAAANAIADTFHTLYPSDQKQEEQEKQEEEPAQS